MGPVTPVAAPAPAARPEARPVTVQNLLFVLGGLLVGAAAVVFTGVAIGGLVLIAVAMTYERRLRDLRRLRGAIARMT